MTLASKSVLYIYCGFFIIAMDEIKASKMKETNVFVHNFGITFTVMLAKIV